MKITEGEIWEKVMYRRVSKMKTLEKKGSTKNGILRLIFVAFAILLEVCLVIFILMSRLGRYAEVIAIVSRIIKNFGT